MDTETFLAELKALGALPKEQLEKAVQLAKQMNHYQRESFMEKLKQANEEMLTIYEKAKSLDQQADVLHKNIRQFKRDETEEVVHDQELQEFEKQFFSKS